MQKAETATAIVIDDEENSRKLLLRILKDYTPEIKVLADASNIQAGLELIEKHKPDVLFLDVEMPGGTGLQLAGQLSYEPFIIFVTAHEHYAIKAIKAGADDYLLKPVDIDDVLTAVEKILKKHKIKNDSSIRNKTADTAPSSPKLSVNTKEGTIFLSQEDIIRLEADGAYSQVQLVQGKKHLFSKNLKEISQQLTLPVFVRVHASHIINLSFVTKIIRTEGLFAEMSNGEKIPVSRSMKEHFFELMEKYRHGAI